jgi:hypothetical protein
MNLIVVRSRRWFLYCTASLFAVLFLGILLAGLLLMRHGLVLREGIVSGSSMEPHFQGPRWQWTCPQCECIQQSCADTTDVNKSLHCANCTEEIVPLSEFGPSREEESARKVPGERVRIAPMRAIRSLRQADKSTLANKTMYPSGTIHPSGLRRGDVVVLKPTSESQKEIKRLVGFPDEAIAIREGDLFVDGIRWEKSLQESLRQSIVVDSKQGPLFLQKNDDSESESRPWIWHKPIFNELPLNQHDSHQLRAVKDVGIVFQVSQDSDHWKLDLQIETAKSIQTPDATQVAIERSDSFMKASMAQNSAVLSPDLVDAWQGWIALVHFDGNWIIGDGVREWLRAPGKGRQASTAEVGETDEARFQLSCTTGELRIEQVIMVRDIMWLGDQDRLEQGWDASPGLVFLGDNVSSSGDSRQRWEVRPSISNIKGILLEPENPIESLLKQLSR